MSTGFRNAAFIAALLFAGLLVAAAFALRAPDEHRLVLGDKTFAVPAKFLLEGSVPTWRRLIPGLDDSSRDVLLKFPAREVRARVARYSASDGQFEEDIIARLVALTEDEVQRHLDAERYRDLWMGEGSYADSVVEQYNNKSWFKVFRRTEYPQSWAVVSRLPDGSKALPERVADFWVAHCLSGPSSVTPSGDHTTCMTYRIFDHLMIELNVSDQNLGVVGPTAEYIVDTIREWETSADK